MGIETARYAVPRVAGSLLHASRLNDDVARLKYVSGAREEALRRLGINTVGDLLTHIPRRYLDFSHACTIEEAPLGEVCTIVATVDRVREKHPRPRLSVVEVFLVDETGALQLAFFKQHWIARELAPGDRLAVIGKVEFAYGFKQMSSPHYEKLDERAQAGTIVPVHPVGEGVTVAWMRRIVSVALHNIAGIVDALPARLRARRGLMSAQAALRSIHFPFDFVERDCARERLAYDELLYLQLALRLRNDANLQALRRREAPNHSVNVLGRPNQNRLRQARPITQPRVFGRKNRLLALRALGVVLRLAVRQWGRVRFPVALLEWLAALLKESATHCCSSCAHLYRCFRKAGLRLRSSLLPSCSDSGFS